MAKKIKILKIKQLTRDVFRFRTIKPSGLKFKSGQATELAINKPSLSKMKRPFTFTSLPADNFLEFTIKTYKDHDDGITKYLPKLKQGDEFLIHEVFGAIHYKGPGVFIAGGAGVTPFISILRSLKQQNKLKGNTLIFSNKTSKDIILKNEFDEMAKQGLRVVYVLTREQNPDYYNKRITPDYLKSNIKNFNQHFYICGPIGMVGEIQHILRQLGTVSDSIVIET